MSENVKRACEGVTDLGFEKGNSLATGENIAKAAGTAASMVRMAEAQSK